MISILINEVIEILARPKRMELGIEPQNHLYTAPSPHPTPVLCALLSQVHQPACCMLFWVKFHQGTATSICLSISYGCFFTTAELSTCDRGLTAYKDYSIYSLVLCRKELPIQFYIISSSGNLTFFFPNTFLGFAGFQCMLTEGRMKRSDGGRITTDKVSRFDHI